MLKRDMDLLRKILLEVEEHAVGGNNWVPLRFEGFSEIEVTYHVKLLREAGFIQASSVPDETRFIRPTRMLWNGHEFLDSIRNDSVWADMKNKIGKDLSTLPITVIGAVALEAAKAFALGKLGLNK
ncbi:DUF2513 domain-containing protein [Paenibacillus sp. CF384]|uniref:DUF2513 domain-containing protein n=1 Tax=Paenibacillus sp. CF384 TaxID=1884382 RepID=UPI00089B2A45|nr:DUF2513 domain-containing protein [Paenibacillus sp. CF384]SDW79768.1 Hypothetical protein SAMN05518855_1005148 [Paenibacillus sp. CF384]